MSPNHLSARDPSLVLLNDGFSGDTPFWKRRSVRALAIFVVAVLVRIPFRATYLVNWDSVNFALGIESFDLATHQPHPPGYLGYVVLGRIIDWFVGDPVVAMTGISIVAGAAATTGTYVLATRFVSERAALIAAGLFGTSPLVWYYSEVPLTYIVEVALALPFVLLIHEARKRAVPGFLYAAAGLLAVIGAIRQTGLILFFPLFVYAALAFPWKVRLRGAALIGTLVTAWLVPLLILSGGLVNYLRLSSQLAGLTGGATWLGAGAGVLQNFIVVTLAIVLGMHVALLAIPLERFAKDKSLPFAPDDRRLMVIWGLPPLLTYLFIHSGQLGYVLLLLPIGIIWASKVFDARLGAAALKAAAAAAALIAANSLGFFVLPEIAYATVSEGRVDFPARMASDTLVQRGIQQVSLPRNDAHWEALLAWIESFQSDEVVVLAEPRDGGSFRHLSFYQPDFLVYGLGTDKKGTFGHLFTSSENSTDYSVEKLDEAKSNLQFPEDVNTVLVLDPRLQERLDGVLALEYETLDNGAVVAWAEVPKHSPIVFLGQSGSPGVDVRADLDGVESDNGVLAVKGSCAGTVETPLPYDKATYTVTAC